MPKLSDMYGTDPTGMASKIASDALTNTGGCEEVWAGKAIDQSALGKGNTDARQMDEVVADKQKGDSRAKTQSNH